MSESDTVALIERYFAAVNQRDWMVALACVAEDVAHDLPGGERQIGADLLRSHMVERTLRSEETASDIAVMTAAGGGRAAAEYTLTRAKGGATVAGAFFEIDDGRISRISEHFSPA